MLTGISAITLGTHDMARAVAFYQALGFVLKSGGPTASFTSFHAQLRILRSEFRQPRHHAKNALRYQE